MLPQYLQGSAQPYLSGTQLGVGQGCRPSRHQGPGQCPPTNSQLWSEHLQG